MAILILVTACYGSSLDDYREEAAGINLSILKDMQSVQSRDELIVRLPHLKKLFNKLVDVMIAAHELKAKHTTETPAFSAEDRILSDVLLAELTRVYAIEGARDLVEKIQEEALYRLDAYLKAGERPVN
jgi:hypothetical protein